MSEAQMIERLRAAAVEATRGHHLPPDAAARALAQVGRPREPRRRRYLPVIASVGAVAAVAAGVAVGVALTRGDGGSSPAAGGGCTLSTSPLPTWARAGFSPDAYRTGHRTGEHGAIVAIPFVALRVRQPAGTNNKILWVAHDASPGPLHITARLDGRTVRRSVDLGPSYVDLPAAGCWQLSLSWPGHTDSLRLAYRP